MSDLSIQASFNSGEWAPALYARVDMQKYRSGAALLENWFVDYRGGASTRTGTRYILQAYKSATAVRLIPFQASFDVGYVLEFGDEYIRFFIDGAPVLEDPFSITAATKANPCVVTIPGNDFIAGDWIYIGGVVGMTELNRHYFRILNAAGSSITLGDLNGNPINSTGYTTYVSDGEARRVYTISSPYAAADLAIIKYAQNVSQLILCHPDYPPYVLSLVTAANWTLLPIVFGSTSPTPTGVTASSTLGAGSVYYSYVVTSIDSNGQESSPSTAATLSARTDIRTMAGSNTISWPAVPGAVGYNVYEATVRYGAPVPAGVSYGFIGTTQGTEFVDSNIAADFSQSPPIARNPFQGRGVESVEVTSPGTYISVPTISFTGAASDITASAVAVLQVQGTPIISNGGIDYAPGDTILLSDNVVVVVDTVDTTPGPTFGEILTLLPITDPGASPGAIYSGPTPSNPVLQVSTSGAGTGAEIDLVWGVGLVIVINQGAGYLTTPTVTFSSGAATATATLAATSNGYPSVPGFFQQRLVLAAPTGAPQTFYMSQPGAYFNFDITNPVQATNAITGSLVSGQLNTIKSMVSQTSGLLLLTSRASWIVNGGGGPQAGGAVTPTSIVANAQSFNGASDVPPIVANFDVLYVQAKGSIIRDSAYNIYANVFTGTDISVIASHLFYGYEVLEWGWAEEPFKVVWAIRNDGVMLTLTFLKEQEFVGWTHSVTNGNFKSVAVITEGTTTGNVDAVYTVVERTVNNNTVKYIERFSERQYPNGVVDAWCVDSGLQYSGTPATSFSGGEHLAGMTVTGLADGQVITPFVMPVSGNFTLPTAASKVTVGLAFICKLQTLAIELGEPTVQGKVKKINNVDVRVADTLGLKIGSSFSRLVEMKDLVRGNVSSMLTGQDSQVVTDLVTGDARTFLDSTYTIPGQYCIQQDLPYPASVLGVIPNITVGDNR